jgi:hypothetical protein
MPTHDYIIANGTGAAVRADINLALSAIVSLNSSASEPGTMYAYQLWADTGSNPSLLKIRNGANSAWITLRQLDGDFSIVAVEDGLQATPSLTFTNDLNTGVFRSGTDALAIVTGGQYAIACTSTQAVGIKTANPSTALHVAGNARVGADDVTDAHLQIGKGATGNRNSYIDIVGDTTYTDYGLRVIRNNTGANATSELKHRGTGALNFTTEEAAPIVFNTTNSPQVTIDASGRLLVGTSSLRTTGWTTQGAGEIFHEMLNYGGITSFVNANNEEGTFFTLGKSRGTTVGSNTVVANNDRLGGINFQGTDGSAPQLAASITAFVDGTVGANRMPGRLVFSTATDASPSVITPRMTIMSGGAVLIGKTTTSIGTDGIYLGGSGIVELAVSGTSPLRLNRIANDGALVSFQQDGTEEGTISVSGTTVSYNGAHLSRWSQLASGAERTEILRGSILSNLDEMCEWGEEDNEQLNRMKVSTVEGDKNVSGVFQCWDDDDDTYTNDFYCAMTGDFVIRIAEGVTVERGDLLMSAGDGTAKPQDDDIIRSKTIAKVTSTNVSCTYEDGSYCVPCVLMAC